MKKEQRDAFIDKKVKSYVDQTIQNLGRENDISLYILGKDSQFVKALTRRCRECGLPYTLVSEAKDVYRKYFDPIIVDQDEFPHYSHLDNVDDDRYSKHLSSCSSGVLSIIEELGAIGKTVTIIGRGNAVRFLGYALVEDDATVCECNSYTNKSTLNQLTYSADIIVNASPVKKFDRRKSSIVIDVSGATEELTEEDFTISDVGKLTTAILVYRASQRIR